MSDVTEDSPANQHDEWAAEHAQMAQSCAGEDQRDPWLNTPDGEAWLAEQAATPDADATPAATTLDAPEATQ